MMRLELLEEERAGEWNCLSWCSERVLALGGRDGVSVFRETKVMGVWDWERVREESSTAGAFGEPVGGGGGSEERFQGVEGLSHSDTWGVLLVWGVVTGRGGKASHSFLCVWDYKRSALGMILHSRSLLPYNAGYIVGDGGYGLCHVYSTKTILHLDHYNLIISSPPSSSLRGAVAEASTLFLSAHHLSLPTTTQFHSSRHHRINYRQTSLPAPYTSLHGVPCLASLSSNGRAVAIVSKKGAAVLDLSRVHLQDVGREKWRLFGTEKDEGRAKVESLGWWEGGGEDDYLVAGVEMVEMDKGERRLVVWSRRR